jgi:chromosome segregation ATPase
MGFGSLGLEGLQAFGIFLVLGALLFYAWKLFFGNKTITGLLGGFTKGLGTAAKGIYDLRARSRKAKETEKNVSLGMDRAEQMSSTINSELDQIANDQDFNPERIKTLEQQFAVLNQELETEAKRNQELIKLDTENISALNNMLKQGKEFLIAQNSIEGKLKFLEQRLAQRNIQHPELGQAFVMAEEIKKSSTKISGLEQQFIQSQQQIKVILETRKKLFEQCHAFATEITPLLEHEAPLTILPQLQDKIKKFTALIQEFQNPTHSLDNIFETFDPIAQQIQTELIQMQDRSQAQKSIIDRIKIFIQEDISKGKAEKDLANAA